MELKAYQERVMLEVGDYLDALAHARTSVPDYASQEAWRVVKGGMLPAPRRTGTGADLPTICLKVPTGGGKTLLATQVLGLAYKTLLPERNGAGLALWIVPSDQIYKDTLKALKDRNHPYRQGLEYALSRRVEVWEKNEIVRLTPAQLGSGLNILLLKLQGTNRSDKETLKFFRDSSGSIPAHFPPEDDPDAHRALKERIPNLDMLAEDSQTGSYLAKTSVANLVRLNAPVVILDEGHKWTSRLARETVEGFNPTLVVELSATPPKGEANELCKVTGAALLAEDMIKLPINVSNSGQQSWHNCLTEARDKREELARFGREYYATGKPLIRPIVLVQVERTGKDQRGPGVIHSEDVKEYLIQRLSIPEQNVKIKSSDKDDIEGIDLMVEDCPVEWIITKAALQEGWDCPFAYILVSLNNTQSKQSMTQLVGRVLRQPFVEKTPFRELNESYVYCLRQRAEAVVQDVRAALEKEGYEGDAASVMDRSEGSTASLMQTATMQERFRQVYRQPFEGRIFLPRFCVRGEQGDEELDYFRHLLSAAKPEEFDYAAVAEWDFADDLTAAREQFYRVNLNIDGDALLPLGITDKPSAVGETDAQTRAWLVANLELDWFSVRQMRPVVERVCDLLPQVAGQLALVRFRLLEKTKGLILQQTDLQTERRFRALHEQGHLFFFLQCVECRFEIPRVVERRRLRPLLRGDFTPLQKNLFDYQPDDDNEYEKTVALYLDNRPEVLWWYRNIVGRDEFSIQGYKRYRIRPDFVVQQAEGEAPKPTVLVVESKGKQLKGNLDTEYKRHVADYFTKVGREVTWQELGEGFDKHCFRFQILDQGDYADRDWRDDLNRMLQLPQGEMP
ncbi:MAG: DEAD/DEAH box helicase [Janthinobacterium lividum]